MSKHGEIIVAIINNRHDFAIARQKHWYRIPISSQRKWLKDCWPPQWVAFYQTTVFAAEKYAIRYYARVLDIQSVSRHQLFPDEPPNVKSEQQYYQVFLGPLDQLSQSIYSRRWRRLVFIPTTWQKFSTAAEINDLYGGSPLEDRVWAILKQHNIPAERQEFVPLEKKTYALDFAIYCAKGKIDGETDGDTWHVGRKQAGKDNLRNNDLGAAGWQVLRFNTIQVMKEVETYCLPKIVQTINTLGGLDEGGLLPRQIDLDPPGGAYQLRLFEAE